MDRDYLAYLGAMQRQKEIAQETAALEKFIRDYEKRNRSTRLKIVHAVPSEDGTVRRTRRMLMERQTEEARQRKTRKRKPMSAARRKAVGERMRKYWAQRKASEAGKRR